MKIPILCVCLFKTVNAVQLNHLPDSAAKLIIRGCNRTSDCKQNLINLKRDLSNEKTNYHGRGITN